jgi:alkylation response protein AidB-like acyl-CoA dehydrogenase
VTERQREHPMVAAVQLVCDRLLAPGAAAVDAGGVPVSHLRALAGAGMFGIAATGMDGEAVVPPWVQRRVSELVAGADLTTWFVQAQHHAVVRALTAGRRHPDELAQLVRGHVVAGIAFSQLRRWPQRVARADRVAGGWRLAGDLPWYTGWLLNDVMLLHALTPDGTVVQALSPARPQPGLSASRALATAALAGSATVTLSLDGLRIDDDDVVAMPSVEQWLAADERTTANANPAVFGLATAIVARLRTHGEQRDEPEAVAAATRLGDQVDRLRTSAYRLVDEIAPGDQLDRRLQVRADAGRVVAEAAACYVTACAGAAMLPGHPAQRHAREAMFLQVQGQTAAVRRAALRVWGRG